MHLFDDVVCGGVPDEGFWVKVAVVDPGGDGVDQVGDRGEDPSFEAAVGQLFEEAFDQVQPRARGRGVVQVPAGPAGWASQVATSGPVWADRLSSTTWISRLRGTVASIRLKKARMSALV